MAGAFQWSWDQNAYNKVKKPLTGSIAEVFTPWWERIAEEAKSLAEAEAPVGLADARGPGGMLKRSHRIRKVNQFRIDIVNFAPQAVYVHWGFRAHWMPPGIVPFPVMKVIASRDQPPNPWIERALKRMDARMPNRMEEFVRSDLMPWFKSQK